MSAWDADARTFYRDQARMHPGGILPSFVELIDLLETAERRATEADGLRARLDRVDALHRPMTVGGRLWCAACTAKPWPCATAEAMSARGET